MAERAEGEVVRKWEGGRGERARRRGVECRRAGWGREGGPLRSGNANVRPLRLGKTIFFIFFIFSTSLHSDVIFRRGRDGDAW